MTNNKDRTKEHAYSGFKKLLNIITILALIGFVYALRKQIGETLTNLQSANFLALALMPLFQLVNYHSYAKMYGYLFEVMDEKISYKRLFKVQLELNFVNNVFPSGGVSGISYFGLRMRKYGIGAGKSTLVQVLKFVLLFVSFQILLASGLIILSLGGKASNLLILIAGSLATLLLVGTLLLAYIIGSRERIHSFFAFATKVINRVIHIFRPKHPETISVKKVRDLFDELHDNYMLIKNDLKRLKKPLLYGLLANISEVLTIYAVYMALGNYINIGAVIIAYAIANFAGLISVLPGGVGVYEALMTATLAAAGIAAAVSIPVTVMYRILNTTLQLIPGYYYYHKNLRSRQDDEDDLNED